MEILRRLPLSARENARPSLQELVLHDQYPARYLARLIDAAHAAGVRPVRWLFPARPDTFVRERARIEEAVVAALRVGHGVECYLAGFETFSEAEMVRYNKGSDVATSLRAVAVMRELRRQYPASFEFA